MFTAFRCFTDGCNDRDGKPLQEHLRMKMDDFGGVFMSSRLRFNSHFLLFSSKK